MRVESLEIKVAIQVLKPASTVFDAISEASYARVFRYSIPGRDNRYVMLLRSQKNTAKRNVDISV